MYNAFKKILTPPTFAEDDDKTRSAAILNTIGWSTIAILLTLLVIRTMQGQDINLTEVNLILTITAIAIGFMLYVSRRGHVKAASLLFVTTIWI